MIRLIVGTKGSGKTKAMIDMINESVRTTKGSVVVVEKGMKLTYDISSAARLIDLDEYKIQGGEMLYGFVAGLMASNYDITDIYIDGILKVLHRQRRRSHAAPQRQEVPVRLHRSPKAEQAPGSKPPTIRGKAESRGLIVKNICRCAIWGLTQGPFGAILTRQLFRGVLCNLT